MAKMTRTEKAEDRQEATKIKQQIKKEKRAHQQQKKQEEAKKKILQPVGDIYKLRMIFAFVCWGSISVLILWGLSFLIEMASWWELIAFVGIFSIVTGASWKSFTFDVPAWTGINLYNYFTGKQTTFLPGLHFRFPWELVRPQSTHSLKSMKESLEESYPTGGGTDGEGSTVLLAKFMFQFRPDPFNLITYEGVDNEVIKSGLVDQASSLLLSYIATQKKSAKEIRDDISHLQEAIREKFGVDEDEVRTIDKNRKLKQLGRVSTPIELSYGIVLIVASLNDLDFEPEYQKILTSRKTMEEIQAVANSIFEKAEGDMTRKEAWDEAMVVSGKASGNIVKTTGGQAVPFVNINGGKR